MNSKSCVVTWHYLQVLVHCHCPLLYVSHHEPPCCHWLQQHPERKDSDAVIHYINDSHVLRSQTLLKLSPFKHLYKEQEWEKDTCLSIFDHGSQGLSCFLKNTNTADSTKMTRWAWNSKQWQQVIQKQQYSAVVEINNNVRILHFKNTNKWALRLFKQQVMWPKFYEIESNSQITQNPNWKSQEFMARELKNIICLCIKV